MAVVSYLDPEAGTFFHFFFPLQALGPFISMLCVKLFVAALVGISFIRALQAEIVELWKKEESEVASK